MWVCPFNQDLGSVDESLSFPELITFLCLLNDGAAIAPNGQEIGDQEYARIIKCKLLGLAHNYTIPKRPTKNALQIISSL